MKTILIIMSVCSLLVIIIAIRNYMRATRVDRKIKRIKRKAEQRNREIIDRMQMRKFNR